MQTLEACTLNLLTRCELQKVSKYNLAVENSSESPVLCASDLHPGLILYFFSKTTSFFT